jgi:hypothetical protein
VSSHASIDLELEMIEGWVEEIIEKYVKEEFQARENYMHMECEKICDNLFISTKKRYVGRIVWMEGKWLEKPEYIYRGFEVRRKNTSYFTDLSQYDLMKILMKSASSRSEMIDYMRALKTRFFSAGPCEIGDVTYLAKPVQAYNNEQQAKAARVANKLWGKRYGVDDDFYLVHVNKLPLSVPSEICGKVPVVAVDEATENLFLQQGLSIDYEFHWQHLLEILQPILEINNIDELNMISNSCPKFNW